VHRFNVVVSTFVRITSVIGPLVLIINDILTISFIKTYNPLTQSISGLIITKFGWIEKIGISGIIISLLFLSLHFIAPPIIKHLTLKQIAGFLLAITAIGFILILVFDTDPAGVTNSIHGRIHFTVTIIVSTIFPLVCLLTALSLRREGKSKAIIIFSFTVGFVALILGMITVITNFGHLRIGLFERFLSLVNLTWIVVVGSILNRR
jgi:hypothetical protein